MVEWVKDHVKFILHLGTQDEFCAVVRCIQQARRDFDCDPVLRFAQDEIEILQNLLCHLERIAFISTLLSVTSVA